MTPMGIPGKRGMMKTKEIKGVTPARFNLLRVLAGDGTPSGRQELSRPWLEANGLTDANGITAKGIRWLDRHHVESGKVVECERRTRIPATRVRKDYGLTETMMGELLPPSITLPNPYHRSGPPMRLWYDDEVAAVCEQPEIRKRLDELAKRKAKRSEAALRAAETKRSKTRRHVDEAIGRIRVKRIPMDRLERLAVRSKADWYDATDRWEEAATAASAPRDVIERWMVNYIRHHLTRYDRELWELSGRTGCHEEYRRFKTAVLNAIMDAYPELADAVNRAKSWMGNAFMPVESEYEMRLAAERAGRNDGADACVVRQ